jgi:ankyrin repeat protein
MQDVQLKPRYTVGTFCLLLQLLLMLATPYALAAGEANDGTDAEKQLSDSIDRLEPEGVRAALARGAAADSPYHDGGKRPLEWLATGLIYAEAVESVPVSEREERAVAIAKMLLAAGAKVRAGNQLLTWPVKYGMTHLTLTLIEAGVDPNWTDNETGLDAACGAIVDGREEMVAILLQHGAKRPDATALRQDMLVAGIDRGEVETVLQCVRGGANLNNQNKRGESALTMAAGNGNVGIVWFLLEGGANPNAEGRHFVLPISASALHAAVERATMEESSSRNLHTKNPPDYLNVVRLLLAYGSDVSSASAYKSRTPLHLAAEGGAINVATILLKAHAKVMAKDAEGHTPLDLAKSGPMIELLKAYGATER